MFRVQFRQISLISKTKYECNNNQLPENKNPINFHNAMHVRA
jgi:hypothetical protein